MLVFDIIDTGVGIPKESQLRLFKAFTKIMKNRQLNTEGCGLGLSISKLIAHALGGDIEFKSVYSEGSTFTLVMPFRNGQPSPPSPYSLNLSILENHRVDTNRSFIQKEERSEETIDKEYNVASRSCLD